MPSSITDMRNKKGQFIKTERIKKNCMSCSKEFGVYPYQEEKTIFCSQKCWSKYCREKRVAKNCTVCKKEFRVCPALMRVKCCSRACSGILKRGKNYLAKMSDQSRNSYANIAWKRGVRRRFGNSPYCFDCGEVKALEINHIYPWAKYPRLRYEVLNGEMICKDCHKVKTRAQMAKQNKLVYV